MSVRHWRSRALLREAFLNSVNLRSRTFISLAVAVMAGSTAVAFYASESTHFAEGLQDLEIRGSNILTLQSATPHKDIAISRTSCEALTRLPEVERAGLLIDAGSLDIPEIGANTRIFTASTTLFRQLATEPGVIGFKLTRSRAPRTVTVAPSQTRQLGTLVQQPEGIPTNSAVVFPLPAGTSSGPVCIVSLTRFHDPKAVAPTLAAALETQGGPIMGDPELPLTSDPVHDWNTRPGQYLPLVLGILGGLLTSTVTWTRSSELAAYRLSGTSRRSIGILVTLESLFPAGSYLLSAAAALSAATIVGAHILSPTEQMNWVLAGAVGWSTVGAVGALRSMLASPAKMTREK